MARPSVSLLLLLALIPARDATAQLSRPIGPFVVDARGFFSGLGQDPITATELAVLATDLPGRGLGGSVGVHVYPLRTQSFAFGIGGDVLVMRGTSTIAALEEVPARTISQRYRSVSGVISLNFGHRNGWSYVSAGLGPAAFYTYEDDARPAETPATQTTVNGGGGARWFFSNHVAFTFDVRFHLTRPQLATASYPARQRTRLTIISAGISLR